MPEDLVGPFTRITVPEEDQDVEKRQAAKDLRLYGSRMEPPESIEVDERMKLAGLPPKRSASEFSAAVGRPAKVRKKSNNITFSYDTVTAIDWNCGTSPLDAWLNQSALHSVVPASELDSQSIIDRSDELAVIEKEQIQSFRRIHIGSCPEPAVSATRAYRSQMPKDLQSCDARTQIYYRNIVDQYPALPHYVAIRLAEANCSRAERLQRVRNEPKNVTKLSFSGQRNRSMFSLARDQSQPSAIGLKDVNIQPNDVPWEPSNPWDLATELKKSVFDMEKQKTQRRRAKRTVSGSEPSFWSGRISSPSPCSIKSDSSSNNCSLRGSQTVDPDEQDLSVPKISPASSVDRSCMSPTLVPPPVKLGKGITFTCNICGQLVTAARRLEWQ